MTTGSFIKYITTMDLEEKKKDETNTIKSFWKEVNMNPPDLFIMGSNEDYFGLS